MFFKKKDEGKLPDLPPLSTDDLKMNFDRPAGRAMLPGLDDLSHLSGRNNVEEEKHALPTFPDSPMQKGFSQSAIREAIGQPESNDALPELPEEQEWDTKTNDEWKEQPEEVLDESNEVLEMPNYPIKKVKIIESQGNEGYTPVVRELPMTREVREPVMKEVREQFKPAKKNEDIFVRIDKFRMARKSLNEAKMGMQEIDNLLRKIRETKMREEQELSAWEKEMAEIKSRLKDVTENIFEKAE